MIFIRDSVALLRFDLMTRQENYKRITEEHEHKDRKSPRLEGSIQSQKFFTEYWDGRWQ